jgi:hypothetical protein
LWGGKDGRWTRSRIAGAPVASASGCDGEDTGDVEACRRTDTIARAVADHERAITRRTTPAGRAAKPGEAVGRRARATRCELRR